MYQSFFQIVCDLKQNPLLSQSPISWFQKVQLPYQIGHCSKFALQPGWKGEGKNEIQKFTGFKRIEQRKERTLNPSPGFEMTFSAGTGQLSKNTAAVLEALMPIF